MDKSRKKLVTAIIISALLSASVTVVATGGLRIASGVYGVLSGYGNATMVCTDTEGNILNGVTIKTTDVPISNGSGNIGNGVTFTCP